MKKLLLLLTLMFCASLLVAAPAWADDESELANRETSLQRDLERENKQKDYEKKLMEKYGLTEQQIQELHKKGMNDSQITIAAQLAKSSEKPIDDIVKMRFEQKMGWGKIAKELGVPPREIGHSIAASRREIQERKQKHVRDGVREERLERKERRDERKEDRHGKGERSGKHGKN